MRGVALAAALLAVLSAGAAKAADTLDNQATIRGCITAAAKVYRLPPAVLVILLNVERGLLGHVSPNTNGTVDIGPIQVNQIWLPELAAHWHATIADAYSALRDNFCAKCRGRSMDIAPRPRRGARRLLGRGGLLPLPHVGA